MSDRKFKFRMHGEYTGDDHAIANLQYERMTEHGWQEHDPRNYTAGFWIFLHAVFNCHHMYFRINTAERNLKISKVSGQMEVEAKENWEITKLEVHIDGRLESGDPSEDDLAYIVDRIRHCPASMNLKFGGAVTTVSIA